MINIAMRQAASKDLTSGRVEGEKILVAVSSVSLAAVVALLVIIIIAALKTTSRKPGSGVFRSHVTAYFVSLLVSDLFQAVGSIMNSKWIQDMTVKSGGFCFAQGMIKQIADVSTAFWITTIAVHTFNVLVLGIHIRRILMYLVLIGGWGYIGVIVIIGPLILQTPERGPFFSISGYWCWISDGYPVVKIVLDYMMMFLAATTSSVLYLLVFLKLRGNLRRLHSSMDRNQAGMQHQNDEASDLRAHIVSVTRHMLLYPVSTRAKTLVLEQTEVESGLLCNYFLFLKQTAYVILIVPIAACRFAEWAGHDVPFRVVIFSDSVFLLSGFVNASLFVLTGRVLPLRDILNMFKPSFSAPSRQIMELRLSSLMSGEGGTDVCTVYYPTGTCAGQLEDRRRKELPRLPESVHSAHHRTLRSISHSRNGSDVPSLL